jgi:cytochrome c-type biogenesis protein CcmH
MIWLWIAAALVSAGMAALIVQGAARAARTRRAENPSLAVYRRQMAEIDDLAARGLLAEADRRGIRAETGRRLLSAAARTEAPLEAASPTATLILAALAPLLALAIYIFLGAPGLPDQPFARRLQAWSNTPIDNLSAPELAALMRAAAAQRPRDPGPLYFLAQYELASDQPLEAAQALSRALMLAPRRADLWDLKGAAEVALAGGAMSPSARQDFRQALALDPHAPEARYQLALEKMRGGDVQGGLADWRALAADLPPSDARRASLFNDIAMVQAAGKLPDAAASQVGPPQIQAMVDGLAARLKAQPDDPAGWARLVRAYGVLGEADRQGAALAEARRIYATRPDVLSQIEAAAAAPAGQGR